MTAFASLALPSALLSAGAALIAAALAPAPASAADAHHPLVIELFQSQGCSSCPPANALLIDWAKRDDVLALNFAVDYWDSLGWKDIFDSPAYTARQWAYARALQRENVYTPQAILNGRADTTGLDDEELRQLAAKVDRGAGGPAVTVSAGAATIGAGAAPAGGAEVWLAQYDPNVLQVAIKRGENAGRTLPHVNIVKRLALLGRWSGAPARFDLPAKDDARLVDAVLVQGAGQGPILAAARE
ncbi:MAG: DUF1223 domain-containing protein [Bradyrhizobium sp.]|nr:MAG: DUF1223 domain-containing protein [Bradyrhizobium sp.]